MTIPIIHGSTVDHQTRCKHYHSSVDIVAIKMKCCRRYYPCYKCHNECEDHSIIPWENHELDEYAVVCGVCRTELQIKQYIHTDFCPHCHAYFNENCRNHYHLYFKINK